MINVLVGKKYQNKPEDWVLLRFYSAFLDVSERGSPSEMSVTLYQYTRRNIL